MFCKRKSTQLRGFSLKLYSFSAPKIIWFKVIYVLWCEQAFLVITTSNGWNVNNDGKREWGAHWAKKSLSSSKATWHVHCLRFLASAIHRFPWHNQICLVERSLAEQVCCIHYQALSDGWQVNVKQRKPTWGACLPYTLTWRKDYKRVINCSAFAWRTYAELVTHAYVAVSCVGWRNLW